jgi:nucleoside-diphosphate-sugar epimerase
MVTMVIGGTGFIGLNIAERLLTEGKTTVLFDRRPLPAAARQYLSHLPGRLVEKTGDVLDTKGLHACLERERVSHLFFGAAVTADPQREARSPRQIIETNLVGMTSTLEAARDAELERVINLSSGAAYGERAHSDAPLDEDMVLDPVGLYPVTKATSERIVRRLAALWSMQLINVRLSPVFGPWEVDSGVRDLLTPQLQATWLALQRRHGVLMFCDRRDWTYSRELARALVALMAQPTLAHEVYNISCGEVSSSADWCARLAEHYSGFSWQVADESNSANISQHGAPERQPMVTERLRDALGWVPHANIDDWFGDWLVWLEIARSYWSQTGRSI